MPWNEFLRNFIFCKLNKKLLSFFSFFIILLTFSGKSAFDKKNMLSKNDVLFFSVRSLLRQKNFNLTRKTFFTQCYTKTFSKLFSWEVQIIRKNSKALVLFSVFRFKWIFATLVSLSYAQKLNRKTHYHSFRLRTMKDCTKFLPREIYGKLNTVSKKQQNKFWWKLQEWKFQKEEEKVPPSNNWRQ